VTEPEEQGASREGDDDPQRRPAFPCESCGSETHDDVVQAAFWLDTGWIAVEDVPAWTCQGCGEHFYDEPTAGKIEKLLTGPAGRPKQEVAVPVFSLTEVDLPKGESRPEAVDDEDAQAARATFTGTEPAADDAADARETQEPFLCKYCRSDTHEDVAKSALWTDQGLVVIEDIPARVCRECKEQFYDEMTTWKIERLVEQGFPREKASRQISVPVFSLTELA
jgi:YgiT-type zinc finger domain-containing protein